MSQGCPHWWPSSNRSVSREGFFSCKCHLMACSAIYQLQNAYHIVKLAFLCLIFTLSDSPSWVLLFFRHKTNFKSFPGNVYMYLTNSVKILRFNIFQAFFVLYPLWLWFCSLIVFIWDFFFLFSTTSPTNRKWLNASCTSGPSDILPADTCRESTTWSRPSSSSFFRTTWNRTSPGRTAR